MIMVLTKIVALFKTMLFESLRSIIIISAESLI